MLKTETTIHHPRDITITIGLVDRASKPPYHCQQHWNGQLSIMANRGISTSLKNELFFCPSPRNKWLNLIFCSTDRARLTCSLLYKHEHLPLSIKDPVNEAVITMMQEATNPVVSLVFQDGQDGKKKGSSMMTISAGHRESLAKLMTNLESTHPHFVR